MLRSGSQSQPAVVYVQGTPPPGTPVMVYQQVTPGGTPIPPGTTPPSGQIQQATPVPMAIRVNMFKFSVLSEA